MPPSQTPADADPDVLAFGDFLDAFRSLEGTQGADLRRQAGMPHPRFDALIQIACEPEKVLTMSALWAGTSLTSGGTTRLVDRLVEAGYVERRGKLADRRVQLVALTDQGASALDAAAEVHRENIREHFTGKLSPEELGEFLRLLGRVRAPAQRGGLGMRARTHRVRPLPYAPRHSSGMHEPPSRQPVGGM